HIVGLHHPWILMDTLYLKTYLSLLVELFLSLTFAGFLFLDALKVSVMVASCSLHIKYDYVLLGIRIFMWNPGCRINLSKWNMRDSCGMKGLGETPQGEA